jgi:exo-1,4-beta-D-glucosaminidase
MKHFIAPFLVTLFLFSFCIIPAKSQLKTDNQFDTELHGHWYIQSTAKVADGGDVISTSAFHPQHWYPTSVPHTVLGTLVDDGVYKNVFFGRNLTKIPDSLFNVPWWYRTTFNLQALRKNQITRIRFNGINYRADIWLNGHLVASSDTLLGSFRRFTINVTPFAHAGNNILAVKIYRPEDGDLSIGFVDWNPEPADHDMGIWRDVHLLISGPVSVDLPFVQTDVDTATLDHANITISAVVHNYDDHDVNGILFATISGGIHISQPVSIPANSSQVVIFKPDQYSALSMDHPKLWWTRDWGKPNLYDLTLTFSENNSISDEQHVRFGIRTVTGYITKEGFRGYMLNGKKILIKGGGWTDPMLLNATPEYETAGIDYAVQMHLDAIRMEGFWGEDQHIYNLCDEKGILIMVGFSCQWEWQEFEGIPADKYGTIRTPEQIEMATKSWRDQITWLRNHPSIFLWLYGSDKWPRPALEKNYLEVLANDDPTRPYAQSAAEHTSVITGPTCMKMRGPYDYVPPDYWFIDVKDGGAFGFNTETSPGPEVPVLESLKKMIPADSLWPIGSAWLFHAARGNFHNLHYYNQAMNNRLGKPKDLTDYLRKAQYLNYEGERAMFEAFEANRYVSTGIIQWMYNASWPKLWWQLYDYYLMPTGALYGVEKACEPVHISYNYKTNGVDIINNTLQDHHHLTADIKMLNYNLSLADQQTVPVDELDGRQTLHLPSLPTDKNLSTTYFVDLKLRNRQNEVISNNFYVLSTQKDLLDTAKSTWYVTPQTQYSDLTDLQNLPIVKLKSSEKFEHRGDSTWVSVTIKNPTNHLAFMIHLDFMKKKSGQSVVPIFWDDNYITLLPGEERVIRGYCFTRNLDGEEPEVKISGWNIE